jgi:hypothetical protein
LSALFVEAGLRTLCKVHSVDLVRLLVVLCDDSRTCKSLLNRVICILIAPLSVLSNFLHLLEDGVGTNDFKANVDIEQTALFFHYQSRVKTRPHLNIVRIKAVGVCLVECLLADGFEAETAHH